MKKRYEIVVVSHTHWDREWYLNFHKFWFKIVQAIDELLEIIERDTEYGGFTLDGQTVVLEDYLRVRPEMKQKIINYIQKGKIQIGPWYVQPDEFIVSGEALIHNLLLGYKLSQEFGGYMDVGYLPDAWGHISQLPQIMQGFDIDSCIFTRGVGDEGEELKDLFNWIAPDGSQVIAHHQIGTYGNAANLPEDPETAILSFRIIKKCMEPYAATSILLFNNGADHQLPQPHIPKLIKYANQAFDDATFTHGCYRDFINKVKRENPKLKQHKGELRGSRYQVLVPGTVSTRMYLKQANRKIEKLIEKWAEPFATVAWSLGESYPQTLLWEAWRSLLKNHAHDSIGGACVDESHKDMAYRFDEAQRIGQEITERSLRTIVSKINTFTNDERDTPIVVFNPSGSDRSEVVEASFYLTEKEAEKFCIIDSTTNQYVPYQILDRRRKIVHERGGNQLDLMKMLGFPERTQVRHYKVMENVEKDRLEIEVQWGMAKSPDVNLASLAKEILPRIFKHPKINRYRLRAWQNEVKVAFFAQNIPAFGYKVYWIRAGEEKNFPSSLKVGKQTLENEFLALKVNQNGTVDIKDKVTGEKYPGCNLFEDTEDVGDEYNFSPADNSLPLTSTDLEAKISLVETGPVRATIKVQIEFPIPTCVNPDRESRSSKKITCPITGYITLY
ncbi:MAG: glycoside hydrolase family 38 C-terminal domain-containing protein, partial [bacterium]